MNKIPCLALITQDCREEGSATGLYGIYEGDFPRSIQYALAGANQPWNHCQYSEEIMQIMKNIGMVEPKFFNDLAAGQLGLSLPIFGCDEHVMKTMENHYNLSEKLRKESDSGCYFIRKNPRILLEDGSYVWGDQCWWTAVEGNERINELLGRSKLQVEAFSRLVASFESSIYLKALRFRASSRNIVHPQTLRRPGRKARRSPLCSKLHIWA